MLDALKPLMNAASAKFAELALFLIFAALTIGALILPFWVPNFGSPRYEPAVSAALSIGTGGIVSLTFYYLMTVRLEKQRRRKIRDNIKSTYWEAKRNIALAVIHASQKGGRSDITANIETIEKTLTLTGFRQIFENGKESDEGFYAFQNQMSDNTPEYDEIIFNLKIICRTLERVVDNHHIDDSNTYQSFVGITTLIQRIDRNGPGYDESKPLCALIWQMFAGWCPIYGKLEYDLVERVIGQL